MEKYILEFCNEMQDSLKRIPTLEISKALHLIQSVYERDGRIYIFGNGGSMALATHWVSDFNKTVFSRNLASKRKRFQAIRLPSTEEELSSWANDVGFDMVFAGPLKNYLKETDCVIAISSSGNSENIIKAVRLAKERAVPVIGLSGFDGGDLYRLADVRICIQTEIGKYEIVESVHATILHLITKYFQDYFNHLEEEYV